MKLIVKVTYRVNLDSDEPIKFAEETEAQRWQMFQHKYGIEPLELKIEEVKG